jgi:hypothetical protein
MKERHVTRRSFFGIGATSMTEQAHSPNGTPFLRVCEPKAPEFQSTLRLCKEYLRTFRKRYGAGTSYRVLLFREGRPIRQVKAGPYVWEPINGQEAILVLEEAFATGHPVTVVTG